MRGYKEIGYEIRVDTKAGKRGILFNKTDFKRLFNEDVSSAHREIFIVSPSLVAGRVTKLLRVYNGLAEKAEAAVGARVSDGERASCQIDRLRKAGGDAVETRSELHLRCAVIDGSLVWYGSISPLGYAGDTDSYLRFDSREISEILISQIKTND